MKGIEEDIWKAVDGDYDPESLRAALIDARWLAHHVYDDAVANYVDEKQVELKYMAIEIR